MAHRPRRARAAPGARRLQAARHRLRLLDPRIFRARRPRDRARKHARSALHLPLGNDRAVECLREGAIDYVLKDSPRRLGPAVRRALAEVAERSAYDARIRHLANYDALTGLPNRTLLRDRLQQAIAHGARTERATAVVVFNIDSFHRVNDAFGSVAG